MVATGVWSRSSCLRDLKSEVQSRAQDRGRTEVCQGAVSPAVKAYLGAVADRGSKKLAREPCLVETQEVVQSIGRFV